MIRNTTPTKERRTRQRTSPSFASRKAEKRVEGLTRSELLVKYQMKVRMIASRICASLPSSVELSDLVSVGMIGLMDAADKFDPSKNARFSSYAEHRIRGAILDELRRQDWVPHEVRAKLKAIEAASQEIERETGEHATEEKIAKRVRTSKKEIQKLQSGPGALALVSMDSANAGEAIEVEGKGETPFEHAAHSDTREYLEAVMRENLSFEEKLTLTSYYFRGLSLKQVAEILSVTESRACQIHTQAVIKLKKKLQRQVFNVLLSA